MEACLSVEREQDKVLKKLKILSGSSAEKLQKMIDKIMEIKQQLGHCEYYSNYSTL